MKTTVDLPSDLVVEAKKAAVERRTTLKTLIESGLRKELEQSSHNPKKLRIVTAPGGLPTDFNVLKRAQLVAAISKDRARKR